MTVRKRGRKAKRLSTKQLAKVRENTRDKRELNAIKNAHKKSARVPNYENAHKKNIIKEAAMPKLKIEAGTIIRFNYRGKDVHEPRPLVLVLNPRWENHLHGLALRVLSEAELNDLAKMVKVTLSDKASKLLGLRLPKLKVDIQRPYEFYHKRLKKFIKKIDDNPYRQYSLKGISAVKIIDYRFKDMDTKTSKKLAKGYKPKTVYKWSKPKK